MSGIATVKFAMVFEEDLRLVARLLQATITMPAGEDREKAAAALLPVLYRALYHLLELPADDDSIVALGRYPAALRPTGEMWEGKQP